MVKDGLGYVEDYWATSFSRPMRDVSQGGTTNVELIEASEIEGTTSVKFRRPVFAADQFGRSISKDSAAPIILPGTPTATICSTTRNSTLFDSSDHLFRM